MVFLTSTAGDNRVDCGCVLMCSHCSVTISRLMVCCEFSWPVRQGQTCVWEFLPGVMKCPGCQAMRESGGRTEARCIYQNELKGGAETALVSSLSGTLSSDAAPMWTPLDREPWEFDLNVESGWAELWKHNVKDSCFITNNTVDCHQFSEYS